jgi:hypothetical protein
LHRSKKSLFDQLVGTSDDCARDSEAKQPMPESLAAVQRLAFALQPFNAFAVHH